MNKEIEQRICNEQRPIIEGIIAMNCRFQCISLTHVKRLGNNVRVVTQIMKLLFQLISSYCRL